MPHLEVYLELLQQSGAHIVHPAVDLWLRVHGLLLLNDGVGEQVHA